MKNFNKAIILILCSLIFILGFSIEKEKKQDVDIIINAFEKTGAVIETYWLNFNTSIGTYQDDKTMLDIGNKYATIFNLPTRNNLLVLDNKKTYTSKGDWGNGTEVTLQIINYSNKIYINFILIGTSNLNDLHKYYTQLDRKLQEIQLFIKINTCIQGNINDKLSSANQLVLIDEILHNIRADEIEKLDTELLKSISAFTPDISNSIMTGEKMMNIQVATHYDNVKQKTILTMGTPIIVIEY